MINRPGVEIKLISDFDKTAKQSLEARAVDAWHKVYATQRKVVMDYHQLLAQIGKEFLCETSRENEMMGQSKFTLPAWMNC